MESYVKIGYAKKMKREEEKLQSQHIWYLPHPVFNPNQPGKLRVVFDAVSRFRGISLNECLFTWPDLLNILIGVLICFRSNNVAIAAEIEGMFHQVKVTEEDSDALRFLWKEDLSSETSADSYKMLIHIFGAKDSSGCANYALKRTVRDNSNAFAAETFESVLKNYYADDLLKSMVSEQKEIILAKELIEIMRRGGFRGSLNS